MTRSNQISDENVSKMNDEMKTLTFRAGLVLPGVLEVIFFVRGRERTAARPRQRDAFTPREFMLTPKNTKLCGNKTY